MGNKINTDYPALARILTGRREILTAVPEITSDNIINILTTALPTHQANRLDIEFLWKYYKGFQPILGREKKVRPEINNLVVENRANQIVNFKVGYCFGEPIQYVSNSADAEVSGAIAELNAYVFSEDKATKDKTLADWNHICGTAFRMVLPDNMAEDLEDDSPFELYTMDPRCTFVVYHNSVKRTPLLGVTYCKNENDQLVYSCYTRDMYYEILDGTQIIKAEPHILGDVPIIEYPLNQERMGCFEVVIPLLDAMNQTASDRQNGLEQFIQALLVFYNVDIDSTDFKNLQSQGALKLKDSDPQFKAKVEYLVQNLDQSQTQDLVDHQYQTVLEIVGMPNRNGGSSTSDTGTATIVRDGWSDAEARAKNTEEMFKVSERRALRIMLRISEALGGVKLRLRDIQIQFTRRNYENIIQKATVLTSMLSSDKIHPKLAFEHCGMFVDPERAYLESEKYMKENANGQKTAESSDDRGAQNDPIRS